ncbi:MAG: DUF4340 domain-containing protein [Candidatus Krumholzibacteria bacterium]|jgi:hypothetical protein|nr:DUF4340 domain-containing protein [Candidatus Krumholzibacteria bacterium]MDP6668280.1 DUF4340 domain-containing protein [Candidatus Krumholzibacteria bacterium]MDP6797047.1 DUF4340 domain-containing protein [Candidatus Krumholzibacteria bacterium]MDP7022084.1 DUF4340 domain-containing protein [Candidatus Krumholzibacteria bacterium]
MKKVLIPLALILSGFALYLFLREPSRIPDPGNFYPFPVEEIEALDLIHQDHWFRVEKSVDGWKLRVPAEDRVDQHTLFGLLAVLHSENVDSILPAPDPPELAGLENPPLELRIHRAAGTDTLRFGNMNPEARRLWASCSWNDSLLLVSSLLRTRFMSGRRELSEKRILTLESASEILSLEIGNGKGRFALQRSPFGWVVEGPVSLPANRQKIENFLVRLNSHAIIEFLDSGESRLPRYGLDYPRGRMTVHLREGASPIQLDLGNPLLGFYYAWIPGRPSVCLVDSISAGPLLGSYLGFRKPLLLEVQEEEILSITGPEGEIRVQGKDWQDPDGTKLSPAKVKTLLRALSGISTRNVEALQPRREQLERWGLDEPKETFLLEAVRGSQELLLGRELDGTRYFQRAGFPTVYSLPADSLRLPWPL